MNVGVLALQGAITPHLTMLEKIGARAILVTTPEHFQSIDRLIMPGGESTTMLRLIERTGLWHPLAEFVKSKPTWGTCAGAILLAKEVIQPTQKSLHAIDITAERNAYGTQLDSFKTSLTTKCLNSPLAVDFIRAPKLHPISSLVEILAVHNEEPVLLRQKHILVSSFHVELGDDTRLHEYFLSLYRL